MGVLTKAVKRATKTYVRKKKASTAARKSKKKMKASVGTAKRAKEQSAQLRGAANKLSGTARASTTKARQLQEKTQKHMATKAQEGATLKSQVKTVKTVAKRRLKQAAAPAATGVAVGAAAALATRKAKGASPKVMAAAKREAIFSAKTVIKAMKGGISAKERAKMKKAKDLLTKRDKKDGGNRVKLYNEYMSKGVKALRKKYGKSMGGKSRIQDPRKKGGYPAIYKKKK